MKKLRRFVKLSDELSYNNEINENSYNYYSQLLSNFCDANLVDQIQKYFSQISLINSTISGQNVPEELDYNEEFVAKLSSKLNFETFELEEDGYPPIFDIAVEASEKGNLLRSIDNKSVK